MVSEDQRKQKISSLIQGFVYISLAMLTFPPVAVLPMNLVLRRLGKRVLVGVVASMTLFFIASYGIEASIITIFPVVTAFFCIDQSTSDKSAFEVMFSRFLGIMAALLISTLLFLTTSAPDVTSALKEKVLEGLSIVYGDTASEVWNLFTYNFIGIFFFVSLMLFCACFLFYLLSYRFLGQKDKIPTAALLKKQVPGYLIFYAMGALLITYLKVEPLAQVGNNFLICVMALFFLQGLVVTHVLIKRNEEFFLFKTTGLRSAVLVSLLLFFPYILLGFGLTDRMFDFRKIEEAKKEE